MPSRAAATPGPSGGNLGLGQSGVAPGVVGQGQLTGVKARWEPVKKTPGYVAGLVVSGVFAVLVPLLYGALVAGIAYATWWHWTSNAPAPGIGQGRAFLAVFGLYIIPGVIGVVLLIFLIKPLVAPSPYDEGVVVLRESTEPFLFHFVEDVCEVVGAPKPKEIQISIDANASAGFRRGLLSLLLPGDLVLHVGMALPASLNKREFAGVLAHELGHFSQGTGMRLTFLVRTISGWLERVAFRRDSWDEYITSVLASGGGLGMLAALGVFICVLVTRLLLMLIALANNVASGFTMRRMEFDADRYEIQFAGSAAFVSTMHKLQELHEVTPRAIEQARRMCLQRREVPDNLPALIADWQMNLTPEDRDRIRAEAAREATSPLSTHPAPKRRIAQAARMNHPGLYSQESPASELFTDFEGVCKRATYGFFRSVLGPYLLDAKPVKVSGRLQSSGERREQSSTVERFLGFQPPSWRPLFPEIVAPPVVEDHKLAIRNLMKARTDATAAARKAAGATGEYRAAVEESQKWIGVRGAMDAKLRVDFRRIALPSTTREGVSHRLDQLSTRAIASGEAIDDAYDAHRRRMILALGLLSIPEFARTVPEARSARVRELLVALGAMQEVMASVRALREEMSIVNAVGEAITSESSLEKAKPAVRALADRVRDTMADIRQIAGAAPYPYRGDDGNDSNLGERLVGVTPAWRDFEEIFTSADQLLGRFPAEHQRCLSELAALVMEIEASVDRMAAKVKQKGA